ncbi:MAG: 5'-nucleotidase, lipoprotein e(P4) family [Kiritimatiellae bacterium]|nr:5'-nucleotidase, lipoprotein e(P4) family [Kiritimatiellia bacterium]
MQRSPVPFARFLTPGALIALLSLGACGNATRRNEPGEEHPNTMAVLWTKTAAETRALRYQAFNLARLRLDIELRRRRSRKPAIVVDIDETIVNTASFQAGLIAENRRFPEGWKEWIGSGRSEAVPGAVVFLNYAASRGVDLFYVTNRHISMKDDTLKELNRLGCPQAEDSHLACKLDDSSKESRRQAVTATHDLVLLIGDDLNDFSDLFRGQSLENRAKAADLLKDQWGNRFIVLPNPMYGDWESALYAHNRALSAEQLHARRAEALTQP